MLSGFGVFLTKDYQLHLGIWLSVQAIPSWWFSRLQNHHFGYQQESSAKLTNRRISYAFTCSPLNFHARHILPTSKFGIVILVGLFYLLCTDISEQHAWEVWIQFIGLTLLLRRNPANNPITLITLGYIFAADSICVALQISANSFLRKPECQPIGCRARTRF